MGFFEQIQSLLAPRKVECSETGMETELPFDPMNVEDQFEAHVANKPHRVPGFDHFFNSVSMVTTGQEIIKGFRFDINLPLSEYFSFSHSWTFPNSGQPAEQQNPANPMMGAGLQQPTYTFSTQLLQDIRGQEPYTIMLGKMDNEGKRQVIFIKRLFDYVTFRVNGSFHGLPQSFLGLDVEIEGKNSMGVIRIGEGMYGANMMQRVHPKLILGFDYTNLTTQRISMMSYAAKAFIKKHSFFFQYLGMQQQLNLGYVIPIKKGTQFVAHYKNDTREKASKTILGFKQRYEQSEIIATLSSQGQISTILSFKNPSYSLRLCALVDYMKEKYNFGYGITLGQAM